jgi:hypothetical protein
MKNAKDIRGYLATVLGVLSLGFGLHLVGNEDPQVEITAAQALASAGSLVGGVGLTYAGYRSLRIPRSDTSDKDSNG